MTHLQIIYYMLLIAIALLTIILLLSLFLKKQPQQSIAQPKDEPDFYIPSKYFSPFIQWLRWSNVDPHTLTPDDLRDQWATFCKIQEQEGEA